MADETTLCNLALRKIGTNRTITSLSDGSDEADALADVYPFARSALLAEHTWDFATQRAKLARLVQVPAFGYSYYYVLPADFLRILTLQDSGRCDITEYVIEGVSTGTATILAIGTSATTANLTYIADNSLAQDVNQMRIEFRNALVTRLARDLANDLKGDPRLYQLMDAEYRDAIAQARSIDSLSGPPRRIPEPDEILIR